MLIKLKDLQNRAIWVNPNHISHARFYNDYVRIYLPNDDCIDVAHDEWAFIDMNYTDVVAPAPAPSADPEWNSGINTLTFSKLMSNWHGACSTREQDHTLENIQAEKDAYFAVIDYISKTQPPTIAAATPAPVVPITKDRRSELLPILDEYVGCIRNQLVDMSTMAGQAKAAALRDEILDFAAPVVTNASLDPVRVDNMFVEFAADAPSTTIPLSELEEVSDAFAEVDYLCPIVATEITPQQGRALLKLSNAVEKLLFPATHSQESDS